MFPYWLIFTLFAAGAVQTTRADPQRRRSGLMLGLIAVVPAIIIGMRYQTGGDWEPYLYIFQEIGYMDFGTALSYDDPGYSLLNWAANQLGLTIWAVNLVCSGLFFWGLVTFAKHQPNPWVGMLVAVPYLIVVVAVGYTRQAVAIGLIMAAIVAWEQRKLGRFTFYIIVAACFHKTAVIALPLIALSSTRNRLVAIVTVAVFGLLLFNFFVSEAVDKMMTNYVEAGYSSQGAGIRVLMNVLPALIYLYLQKKFNVSENERIMWRYFSFASLATVVMLLVLSSSTAVDRIALYLIPLQIFVFSRLPNVLSKREGVPNGQVILLVIVYSAIVQFVWLNFATHAEYWVPFTLWPLEGAETAPNMDKL